MARFLETIDVPVPIEKAFEYLADFNRTAEWDPGVVEARRLTRGPIRVGTSFRVVASFLGSRSELRYRIEALQPPGRVLLIGENATVRSIDEITFAPSGEGTRITYDARLELRGPLRLFDPLLGAVFQRIGQRAARGLRGALGG